MQELRERCEPAVRNYLQRAGASSAEAAEVVADLWADCLLPRRSGRARLASYNGKAGLETWLNTVAFNAFLLRKRRANLDERVFSHGWIEGDAPGADSPAHRVPAVSAPPDAPLIQLLREAIEAAFLSCPAEDFVILQLAHTDRLRLVELAVIFDCGVSTMSSRLQRASDSIAAATMRHIRESDPWLELQWPDFLDLCRVATPACFGVE